MLLYWPPTPGDPNVRRYYKLASQLEENSLSASEERKRNCESSLLSSGRRKRIKSQKENNNKINEIKKE